MHTLQWSPVIAVPLALASGWLGGWFTFILLARVLWPLQRADGIPKTILPGTHARVVSSIREGGVRRDRLFQGRIALHSRREGGG